MEDKRRNTSMAQMMFILAAFVVVVAGMKSATGILVPFLLAAFITIITAPPMFWLKRKGVPASLSLAIIIFGLLIVVMLGSGLIGSSVKSFSGDLPTYEAKLKQYFSSATGWLDNVGIDASNLELAEVFDPGAVMKIVAKGLNNLGKVLKNGFLIFLTVIFMLIEAFGFPYKLRAVVDDQEGSLSGYRNFVDNVNRYMAIKTMVSLGVGMLVAVFLSIVGTDYPILWGFLAFFLNYVPTIGSFIAAIPAVLLTIIQLGPGYAAVVAAGYLVINLFMANVVETRYMGRGLGLSVLVVFLSLLFWGWVLGPVGMLLSVPLTITVKIALDSYEETKWMAIILGPEVIESEETKDSYDGNELERQII